MSTPMSTVTSTLAMARAARARGVDPTPTLARHGVSWDTLQNPDNEIPVALEFAIWDELRSQTGEPHLQLYAANELPMGTYRVLEYLTGASATVGQGLRRIARFLGIVARQVSLAEHGVGEGCGVVATTADGRPLPPMYADYTFGAIVTRVRHFHPALQVGRVDLRQPQPIDPAPYVAMFGGRVCFGASVDQLWFDRDVWDAPLATHDPSLAQVLEVHAQARLDRLERSVPVVGGDVRQAIIGALPNGAAVSDVARALHVSVRTLQRRLTAANTSYREELDVVRSELARQYLQDQEVAIAEVALLLGFADQSSFHRAFERWTGEPPGRWRAARRRPGAGPE